MILLYIIIIAISYCLGSISFSVIFSKKMSGVDVREQGSKNAGTTNVLRVAGKKPAIFTLIGDILKGIVAILLTYLLGNIFNISSTDLATLIQASALFVILGHMFPVFFKFKGGKGVATSIGILLMINWKIGLICLALGILLIIITRMVSVGSIAAAILFPILTLVITDGYIISNANYLFFGILLALLVLYNHRTNIQRIINGNENKLSFKK